LLFLSWCQLLLLQIPIWVSWAVVWVLIIGYVSLYSFQWVLICSIVGFHLRTVVLKGPRLFELEAFWCFKSFNGCCLLLLLLFCCSELLVHGYDYVFVVNFIGLFSIYEFMFVQIVCGF